MNIKIILEKILDFLFPSTCIVCKKGNEIICKNCFKQIPTCPKDKLNIFSVYEYKNRTINDLLWQLKYHHNGDVAEILREKVSDELKKWLKDFPENIKIIFIPTPLNTNDKRLNNHAETLAIAISKYFPFSEVIENLLAKNSKKKQAHTKNKHERMQNMENSISINQTFLNQKEILQNKFKDKLILIVDDVTTTGATISNIRFTLSEFLEIPEEKILAVTVAH